MRTALSLEKSLGAHDARESRRSAPATTTQMLWLDQKFKKQYCRHSAFELTISWASTMRIKFSGGPRDGEHLQDFGKSAPNYFSVMKLEVFYQKSDGVVNHKTVRHSYRLQGNKYVYEGKKDA
ncbi:UNVERIFIED_ORG: hypothetical protein J2S99_000301 [Atlantibacter hermannii]|nr:hypothetical protein [Atlantibacter hermannii]